MQSLAPLGKTGKSCPSTDIDRSKDVVYTYLHLTLEDKSTEMRH